MTECWGQLFLSLPRQRPYAYPFSHIVWAAGSVILVLTGVLWIRGLYRQREHRPVFAAVSLLIPIPVVPLMILVFDTLWTLMHRLLPSLEALLRR